MSVLEAIAGIGILPVVTIEREDSATPLANALCAGGIPVAEITFRTAAAPGAIARIAAEASGCLVGAGTILTVEQAEAAVAAGARFLVSPGLNPKVVRWAVDKGVPIVPGCSSPTDVEAAMELGLSVLKFFPAGPSGGVPMLGSLGAPYPGVKFVPTGGIGPANLREYLNLSNVAACGGSWMVPKAEIAAGNFARITQLCRQAVQDMLGFTIAHVGINTADETEAKVVGGRFCQLFGLPLIDLPTAFFAGSAVEIVKGPFLGDKGHVGFFTKDLPRALAYLDRLGVELDHGTAAYDEGGKLVNIYLKEQVGGFAIHVKQA